MDSKKIIGFAVGPILSGLFGVVSLPVMAWNFSPADIGRLTMLQLATSLSVIVFSLGMDQAYVRDFHETAESDRPCLFYAAVLPGFLTYFLSFCLIFIFSPGWASHIVFGEKSAIWSMWLFASIAVAFCSRFLSLILRMREQGLAFSLSQSLPKVMFLLAIIFAWMNRSSTFNVLLIAQVGTMTIVLIAYAYLTKRDWLPGMVASFDWVMMWRMSKFGVPLVFGGLASWAVMTLDKVLLRNLSSLEELGIYSVASSLASSVGVATILFTTIWVPTVYKWHANGDALPRIKVASEHALAAACLALAITGLLSPLVAYVLPARYSLVSVLIPACMTLPLFYALSEATSVGLGLGRKSTYSMAASILAAIPGVAAGLILVPRFGASGASLAAVVASFSFVLIRTELAGLAWKPIPRARIYAFVTGMAALVSAYALSDPQDRLLWTIIWALVAMGALLFFKKSVSTVIWIIRRFLSNRLRHRRAN